MSANHPPGTYVAGICGPTGNDLAEFFCPRCWNRFTVSEFDHLDVMMRHMTLMQCMDCNKQESYYHYKGEDDGEVKTRTVVSKNDRKRSNRRRLFSGGLFDTVSDGT